MHPAALAFLAMQHGVPVASAPVAGVRSSRVFADPYRTLGSSHRYATGFGCGGVTAIPMNANKQ